MACPYPRHGLRVWRGRILCLPYPKAMPRVGTCLLQLLLLSFLSRVHAFNITICDCKDSQPKGFFKFSSNDCDFQICPLAPVPVYYDVFSTLPEITRFVGHTCIVQYRNNGLSRRQQMVSRACTQRPRKMASSHRRSAGQL